MTGGLGEEIAVDILKRGATDYVLKNRLSRLAPAVKRALHEMTEKTSRKKLMEMREGEQFMTNIFASIQDGIDIIDKDMNIIHANPTIEKWYPHSIPFAGKKCYEAYHNRSERCEICPAWQTLKTGEAAHEMVPKSGPEGENAGWVEIYSFPMIDTATGEMKGVIEYVRDITERKKIEEALKQSEEKYRMLIDNIHDGVFIIQDAKIQFANASFAKMAGYGVEEVVGKDFNELVAPEDMEMVADRYYRRQAGEDVQQEYEFRILHRDGRTRIIVNMNVGLITFSGRVASMGTVMDITARKEAEKRLEAAHSFLQSIIDGVAEPIMVISEDHRVKLMNRAARELSLKDSSGYSSLLCYQISHGCDVPCSEDRHPCPLEMVRISGKPVTVVHEHQTQDGNTRFVEILASPLFGVDGDFQGIIETSRDITERKKVEEALRESEERYRSLVESSPDAIGVHNLHQLVYANKAMADLLGASSPDELIGKPLQELVHPDSWELVKQRICLEKEGKTVPLIEEKFLKLDGTTVDVEGVGVPVLLKGKIHVQSVLRDITGRKRAEEAIQKYARALEESNRMKELFIDIMHHDLLNPLNIAGGYVELIHDDENDPRKKVYLETIKRNIAKGIDLIDSATRFSKLETLESIELEDMDLKKVIDEVIKNLYPMVTNTGMTIENNICRSMPARANRIIEDVFTNFISNAVKYASQGKRIRVESEDNGDSWKLKVIDFGEGIKDADKPGLFERFRRLEKTGVKGSGLGLAIAGRIVVLHHGKIWIEDNPGGGAIFVVEIPK